MLSYSVLTLSSKEIQCTETNEYYSIINNATDVLMATPEVLFSEVPDPEDRKTLRIILDITNNVSKDKNIGEATRSQFLRTLARDAILARGDVNVN